MGRPEVQQMLQVARWYYEDGKSQNEIAKAIGYSRSSVSRLLSEARRVGIVQITIDHPMEREVALEKQLVQRFGLRGARVTVVDGVAPLAAVAKAGAEMLVDACQNATVLAASAGVTLDALVEELPFLAPRELHVVQMIGALARGNPLLDSSEVARRMAARLGGDYRPMPAPLIVRSGRLAISLRREESVANALALASHADVVIVGIGAISAVSGASGAIFSGWLSPAESAMLRDLGAVGHISGHHFDAHGRHVETDLCERVMSVPLDRVREHPYVIGVATGPEKVAAIHGAVAGGFVNVLVTDVATAKAVLRL